MIRDPVSQTARWTAAARARESARPDRILDDPYAERLATAAGFALLDGMGAGGENAYIVVRTRYLDDLLEREVAAGGQVVLVAAGLDARAWRLEWAPDVILYELDRPEVLGEKVARLGEASTRCERRPVGVDLTAPWTDTLLSAGFDPSVPSVWVVEGLLVYLDGAAVDALLGRIRLLAAPGSRLALDVPAASFLTSTFLAPTLARMEALGAPWRFGTPSPEGMLADHGWADVHVVRPGEPEAHFGRWPWPVLARGATPMENYFVTATAPLRQEPNRTPA